MKLIHYLNFLLIFLIIITICIVEDVLVNNSLTQTQNDCFLIEQQVEKLDDIQNMEVVMLVENLEYNWTNSESQLCYLVNHKSIQEIGQEIAKMKLYIASNDLAQFEVSVELIKSYCKNYLHFMGASFHNIL